MGLSDYYVAAVKGAILSELPGATVVDVSHDIPQYDLLKAAYIVKNAFPNFPKGSIHIVAVNSLEDSETSHVALSHSGHYFIGADSGIFSLIFDEPADEIVQLNFGGARYVKTFPARELFASVACELAKKKSLADIGRKIDSFRKMLLPAASIGSNLIRGSVIYVDSYGNLVTNINRQMFDEIGNGHRFEISLRSTKYGITRISKNYNEVAPGEPVALFNYAGLLEIALNRGPAGKLLGFKVNDAIRIEFDDN